ncbi:MAG: zinc-dependent metalloprotease family protein [Vicingaceae bacterium]|nr:zinc-dependent metalloprotease family protein [Vicingaceae bacterium]
MKKSFLFIVTAIITTSLFAQGNTQNFWTKTDEASVNDIPKVDRNFMPKTYHTFNLDLNALKSALVGAPVRGVANTTNLIIAFPTPEGITEKYKVMESPIMHKDLAVAYPMIKTYVAQGIDDPSAYMRFSVTQRGLHTMCLSGKTGATYIDPYTTDLSTYIVYDRSTIGQDPLGFECTTAEPTQLKSLEGKIENNKAADDKKIRTFRLAQTCTAQYGNIFATTPGQEYADILAAMTVTINRVNSVYEVDLGITLQFISQQNSLMFYGNTNSDPWSGEYNTTTQNFLNSTLNHGDYDIGHNFNTSGGGNAGCIGCVCVNGQKGSGMTGRSNPTGDPFDIDYVAHEMGHQFGGYHTMNTCSRSGSGQTEVEPASGSSVMGYAGICGTNVQNNSDAHFNYVNIRDITQNIKTGNSTCAAITNLTGINNPPTANAGSDYIIPKSTAFILEGTATDPEGLGSLTYEWSQNDPTRAPGNGTPQSTWTVGPLYRAKMPITSPDRFMPRIQDVLAGNLFPTWEKTPTVGRIMNFAFVVRDNDINGGQTADDLMKVIVASGAGPFTVTSQNTTGIIWNEGSSETVTWNVANTTASPVSTANVNIYLSKDGGFTYPITLATNVPNNGSANVTIPTGSITNAARVMVRGAGNIFYAINGKNIKVEMSTGINELNSDNIKVYPNPTNNLLNLTFNKSSSIEQVTLTDLQGKIVYNNNFVQGVNLQINLAGLSNGLYMLNVQTNNGVNIHKVMKQ